MAYYTCKIHGEDAGAACAECHASLRAEVSRAREEGRREVYSLIKRMLSRHGSNEGRTVLGQLCGRLKDRWPGINRRLPKTEEGG